MDPSIMKLLEDDEDESMHSGADVEAFTAALNRDIGGDSLPSDSESALPQGSSSTSNQIYGQWQTSSQEENLAGQLQHQEEQQNLQSLEQHSSQIEPIQKDFGGKNQLQQIDSQPDHDDLLLQQEQSHSDQQQHQTETNPLQFVERNQVKISEDNLVQRPKQEIVPHSESEQQQAVQQLNSQQAPAANQANNSTRKVKLGTVPFQMLIPILRPHLDKDRSMQLLAIYAKLRNNEVNKENFLRVIRNIVGDQMLRQAAQKVQMQFQAQAAQSSQTNPSEYSLQTQVSSQQLSSNSSQQFIEPQSFPPRHPMPSSQNQKGHRSPPHHPHIPTSTVQMQTDPSLPTRENSNPKPGEIENNSDGKGMHAAQISSTSMTVLNPEREHTMVSLQQQQHMQHTSFSMYGSTGTNFHPHSYPRPSFGAATTSLKTQTQDSQMRPPPSQGMISTQLGATLPMNVMNVPKYELQNAANETKRLHGGPLSHLTSHSTLQDPVAWQPSASKEQRSAFPSVTFVKQEVPDQAAETQQKPQFTAPQGSSFGVHSDQGNPTPGSLNDETIERQSSRIGFPTSSSMVVTNQIRGPVGTQADPMMQMRSQIPSASPVLGGPNMRTPTKKPSVGQKRTVEALGTSAPLASKKQKGSGAFLDQSIEQLNDVTAVSGVNLREEEEQLLSAPKEESRASEATRRAVQEEEERLILQKGPLQRKLAEIMSKSGIKSISSDVERCLSMCVEERLRGLISNLIRLSKQRVDIEKTRHRIVVTSDVRRQIMVMNSKAKEEWERKQAEEAEKLRKLNGTEGNAGIEADKEKDKDEGRSKTLKVNKEEDDKLRTTAANVAARAAVGGDDMLSKWQLMAEQARQKREGGLDGASGSQSGKTASRNPSSNLGRTIREQQEVDKRGPSTTISGGLRKLGRSSAIMPHPKVARNISTKDVIAVLESEPHMSRSPLIYRLYGRMPGDSAAE